VLAWEGSEDPLQYNDAPEVDGDLERLVRGEV
jgi:hypothetical protein